MKKRRTISSITSALLIIIILIGSTGAVIIKHTCGSCDLAEYHTEFFNPVPHDDCNCEDEASSCNTDNEKALESDCCTFTPEKLSLTDYTSTTQFNPTSVILTVFYSQSASQVDKFVSPFHSIINHYKHGGRDILRSTCSLII